MTIQSVQRAINILKLFTPTTNRLGVTEISQILSLNKGTAWGLITTLQESGLLAKEESTNKYRLGSAAFELGLNFSRGLEINWVAGGPIHKLAQQTSMPAYLGILDKDSVLITLSSFPEELSAAPQTVGPRLTLHSNGLGKAILSFLSDEALAEFFKNRELISHTPDTIIDPGLLKDELSKWHGFGYAVAKNESVVGRIGIAAPILDVQKNVKAAIGVSGKSFELDEEQIEKIAQTVILMANEISMNLGYQPHI